MKKEDRPVMTFRIEPALRNAVPSSNLGVVFVDNLGLDVTFGTLKCLQTSAEWIC
jgi:hypothetical protein